MENPLTDRKGLYSFMMMIILFVLMLVCQMVSAVFFKFTAPFLFGIADVDTFLRSFPEQLRNPQALIYFEAICSSIGTFLLPVVIYHFIFRYDIVSRMGMKVIPGARYWLMALVVICAAGLFIQCLVQINAAIPLTGKWQELRYPQLESNKIMDALFSDSSIKRYLVLTLTIAILPAVCEELFFRGTVQNTLSQTSLGPTGAIIIAGLAFSLTHFEFDNFLAIWCMGIVLGYLYYYTGSIWINIIAHFFNNALMITAKYAYMRGVIHADMANSDVLPLYLTLPAGAIMIYGLVLMRKWKRPPPLNLP